MDYVSAIAAMSVDMSLQSAQSAASLKMFRNVMDSQEAASAQLIDAIESVPMPAEGVGSLLDVRA